MVLHTVGGRSDFRDKEGARGNVHEITETDVEALEKWPSLNHLLLYEAGLETSSLLKTCS